jgi:hypothetical protein
LLAQLPGIIVGAWVAFRPDSPNALVFVNLYYINLRYFIDAAWQSGFYSVYLLPWLIAVGLTVLGYNNGYRQKHLADKLVFRK